MPAQAVHAVGRSAVGFRRTYRTGYRDFSGPKRDVSAMGDDLHTDLDQLLPQAGHRPRPRRLGLCQLAHEITYIVCEDMELKTHGISGEFPTRQPGPFDRV